MFVGCKVTMESGQCVVVQTVIVDIEDCTVTKVTVEMDSHDGTAVDVKDGVHIGGDVCVNEY